MKKLSFLLALLISQSVFGFDARELYNQKYATVDTGVYEDSGYLFFVVKQQCLTTKKYSGTDESDAAELTFYGLLASEIKQRSVSFDPSSISFDGQLRQDIYDHVSNKYNAKNLISHQLLFDRDNKSCTREYVQIAEAIQFEKNKITIPAIDINNAQSELFSTALKDQDNARIHAYFQSLGLQRLALIYREIESDSVYPFGLQFHSDASTYEKFCNENQYCKSALKINSPHDFNGVLAKVIDAKGIINITSLTNNIALSNEYYIKAKANFDHGQSPHKIISDLTLAINAQSKNAEAWKMLSTIFRATNKEQLALYASNQYIIQTPASVEAWVYLMKSLSALDKDEADSLHSLLVLITSHVELSAWAQKQIKEYR
ncbi:hypothetical protein [Moritella dasanensis]|uniref:hypothetical protein n=1 Tax=Moritella dasanensis TaxID=428031 RepID=UPI00030CABB0|nr:hypothetical protein [Moritella dasanensis]